MRLTCLEEFLGQFPKTDGLETTISDCGRYPFRKHTRR
jgi:hypothetical protein